MAEKIFLTAEWRNLVMANYSVDPGLLQRFVPAGTELDLWQDKCYVSLVGFMFREVRVRGFKIPFHTNFPEVNLRFYVRSKQNNEWKRGVVFISEIVPSPAIVFVANSIFREKYRALQMKNICFEDKTGLLHVVYAWKRKNYWNSITVKADVNPAVLPAGSKEEFITEHFWGYTQVNNQKTAEYQVQHPRWNIHAVNQYEINCDFASLYGMEFSMLAQRSPDSVFLGEGSGVKLFSKRIL